MALDLDNTLRRVVKRVCPYNLAARYDSRKKTIVQNVVGWKQVQYELTSSSLITAAL